jgi:hypothetical protein
VKLSAPAPLSKVVRKEIEMKINKTIVGWEIVPETNEEELRVRWLMESLASHPDQQTCESSSTTQEKAATV